MEKKLFYITTTLPYVNADLHMGHALEFTRADSVARYHKLIGDEVFFNTGTDEHGLKIYRKAVAEGKTPEEYVDFYAARARALIGKLGVMEEINFVRTTDPAHIRAAQEFWKVCDKNGYIYKKNYQANYCVGCESEKTESELVDGKCPDHPSLEIEKITEENYFFKFSEFSDKLLDLYENNPKFVVPDFRLNEIKSFVKNGLQDFSISRLKDKMPWGIEVPGDDKHVMYVWFDALVNYIDAIGWPLDMEKFNKWWLETGGVVQYCGKDNLRYQAATWQAMLMAANIPNSKQIVINGFVTGPGGLKMGKSNDNAVDPLDIINTYGTDAIRYYMLREVHPFLDSPFSEELFKEAYNANLANGLGNLTSRIMKMAESYLDGPVVINEKIDLEKKIGAYLKTYELNKAMDFIWGEIGKLDLYIQENQPFKVYKVEPEKAREMLSFLVKELFSIACLLEPFMPETAEKIKELIKENKAPVVPLFNRVD